MLPTLGNYNTGHYNNNRCRNREGLLLVLTWIISEYTLTPPPLALQSLGCTMATQGTTLTTAAMSPPIVLSQTLFLQSLSTE